MGEEKRIEKKNQPINGLLILNKPEGITSHTAVAKVRRLFGVDKAGHTGTLDPMATGVLPVLLGRGVKAAEYLVEADKRYIAELTLGMDTDTEDSTGNVLSTTDNIPSKEEVLRVLPRFIGEIKQIPPMYSAIKVGGRKLMDLARQGQTIERESRDITIFSLTCEPIDDRRYKLDVTCSKGTYIRTLCHDIGAALGCGGIMSRLCRAEVYGYSLEHSVTLEELESMNGEGKAARVIPVEDLFPETEKVFPVPFFVRLLRNGLAISVKKLGLTNVTVGKRYRIYDGKRFFALGEIQEETNENGETLLTLLPLKQFDI